MLIVWGSKIVRRRLGWVGDFCPVCRTVERLRVTSLKKVGHVYYIPLGRGQVVAHELKCETCGAEYGAKEPKYAAYARFANPDISGLTAETTPDLLDRCGARMELEDRVHTGRLSPEERTRLIMEPFVVLNYAAQKETRGGVIPTGPGLALIGSVFTGIAAAALWQDPKTHVGAAIATGVCLLLASIAVPSIIKASMRSGRGQMDRLARALAPLRPTADDIQATLANLSSQGYVSAKGITPQNLMRAIETFEHRQSSFRGI